MKRTDVFDFLTPSVVVLTTFIYTTMVLSLMLIFISPLAIASSESYFYDKSNASVCSSAARLAVSHGIVHNDDLVACNRAIRGERLSKNNLAKTYNNRGVIKKIMNRRSAALRDYFHSRNIQRDSSSLYVNIGNVFYGGSNYDQAIRYYNKALLIDDSQSVFVGRAALTNRGMAHEQLGDFDSAIVDYQRAVKMSSEASLAQKNLDRLQGSSAIMGPGSSELLISIVGL